MHTFLIRLVFCFVLFNSAVCFGQIKLTDKSNLRYIGNEIQIFDENKQLSAKEAFSSKDFKQSHQDVPNIGLKENSVWIKFSLKNSSQNPHFLLKLAYPILDSVDLYELDTKTGLIRHQSLGEVYPFHLRNYQNPNYIFNIDIPYNESRDYVLKTYSNEPIILPINIGRQEQIWKSLSDESSLMGIYLGIILIMAVYNLFIYFSTKDIGYIYYVLYVIFVGLTQLGIKGFNYQYLWPNEPNFQSKSVSIFACLASIFALYFANYFLQIKTTAPKWSKIIKGLQVLFVISILISLWGNPQIGFQLMQQTTSIGSILIIILSFYVMVKGFQPAIYFFIAWSILLIGSIIFLLKDFGVLPYNIFTSNLIQAASAIEMALLSFGLANRINILKKEKTISQLQALRASKENERIISQQNVVLEQKVSERTQELHQTNEDLNQTLENLKQAQSQLVESEKMASLGQLTAGIAHEINNPINFVTGNVTPLKRDVGMVFETIEFVESIAFANISDSEKKQKIEEYKSDLDYDYLKEEINHLLNGIYEGSSRTAEIVKGLRIFSRVDENDLKNADINEGIDSTLIIINNLLNSSIKINKGYAPDLPLIECYPGKLNQVFLNILSNSIHAIRKKFGVSNGGVITLKTYEQEDAIFISIGDNGVGMNEETIQKIYEPFFTTKEVGEGTGLGMSIVYTTIKKHNGIINIESELGIGTTFIIQLPKKINLENKNER